MAQSVFKQKWAAAQEKQRELWRQWKRMRKNVDDLEIGLQTIVGIKELIKENEVSYEETYQSLEDRLNITRNVVCDIEYELHEIKLRIVAMLAEQAAQQALQRLQRQQAARRRQLVLILDRMQSLKSFMFRHIAEYV